VNGEWECGTYNVSQKKGNHHNRISNFSKMLSDFGRPFVQRFALCYRFVVCPVLSVCLSVCDVRALWPNSWRDQDETWHAGRPRPWPHCVRWGPSSPAQRGTLPIFGPYQLRPNGCIDQDVTWYGPRPRPRRLCVRWRPRSPPQKGGRAPPIFGHVYCGQTAGWMKLVLGMVVGLSPGDFVLDGDPAPPFPKRGRSPCPIFGPFLLWPNGWMHHDTTWYGCRPQPRGLCVRLGLAIVPLCHGTGAPPLTNTGAPFDKNENKIL